MSSRNDFGRGGKRGIQSSARRNGASSSGALPYDPRLERPLDGGGKSDGYLGLRAGLGDGDAVRAYFDGIYAAR